MDAQIARRASREFHESIDLSDLVKLKRISATANNPKCYELNGNDHFGNIFACVEHVSRILICEVDGREHQRTAKLKQQSNNITTNEDGWNESGMNLVQSKPSCFLRDNKE
ncbi:hypothetical protein N7475_007096 [Penicillium sp. IBT 31633x]|nr:hypothetical protein N7475_007096 [Penicillium sp. IBT 31633x]